MKVHIFKATGTPADVRSLIEAVRTTVEKLGIMAGVMDYGKAGAAPLPVASAVLHAIRAFSQGRNLGRTFDSEVMRYAAGQRQISVAIRETGISPTTREFVFFMASKVLCDADVKTLMNVARDAGLESIERLPVNLENRSMSDHHRKSDNE